METLGEFQPNLALGLTKIGEIHMSNNNNMSRCMLYLNMFTLFIPMPTLPFSPLITSLLEKLAGRGSCLSFKA